MIIFHTAIITRNDISVAFGRNVKRNWKLGINKINKPGYNYIWCTFECEGWDIIYKCC